METKRATLQALGDAVAALDQTTQLDAVEVRIYLTPGDPADEPHWSGGIGEAMQMLAGCGKSFDAGNECDYDSLSLVVS